MDLPGAGVVEAPASVGVTEPTTGEPFVSVLVVATGAGGEEVSAGVPVDDVFAGVPVEVSCTGGTGVTCVVEGSGLPPGVVVGVVPLLIAPA